MKSSARGSLQVPRGAAGPAGARSAGYPDPERFVAEFSGSDRTVAEYLLAEMLDRQPPEVQDLLLRTCLLDRVNGELADLLTGRPGSEQILLDLEDANAFVVSLDPRRTWFRYHHLFADLLRLELRRRLPAEAPHSAYQALTPNPTAPGQPHTGPGPAMCGSRRWHAASGDGFVRLEAATRAATPMNETSPTPTWAHTSALIIACLLIRWFGVRVPGGVPVDMRFRRPHGIDRPTGSQLSSVCSNGPGPPRPETVAAKLDRQVRHHPGHIGRPYKRVIVPARTRSG
jgi:hypothetical protein